MNNPEDAEAAALVGRFVGASIEVDDIQDIYARLVDADAEKPGILQGHAEQAILAPAGQEVLVHHHPGPQPQARDQLDRETIEDLEDAIAEAQAAAKTDDLAAVQRTRDALEHATLPLAAVLMDSVAKQALSGKALDEV